MTTSSNISRKNPKKYTSNPTEKHPRIVSDAGHRLTRVAMDLRQIVEYGGDLDKFCSLDGENDLIAGISFILSALLKKISQNADYIDEAVSMLRTEGECEGPEKVLSNNQIM